MATMKSKHLPLRRPGKSGMVKKSIAEGNPEGFFEPEIKVTAVIGFSPRETHASCRVKIPRPQPNSKMLCPGKRWIMCRKDCALHSIRCCAIGSRCAKYHSRYFSRVLRILFCEVSFALNSIHVQIPSRSFHTSIISLIISSKDLVICHPG